MERIFLGIGFLLLVVMVAIVWRRVFLSRYAIERADDRRAKAQKPKTVVRTVRPLGFLIPRPWISWVFGITVILILRWVTDFPQALCMALGITPAVILHLSLGVYRARRAQKLELQLVESLDLAISALRAGTSSMEAISASARETGNPLQMVLSEFSGRVELGDDPQSALDDLQARVPLESFRLFASALSVHWETGGSLGPTLVGVGRTIRDRVELGRRIRGQAAQVFSSVIAMFALTYFLGALVWRAHPEQMEGLITSEVGNMILSLCMILQAAGVLWIHRMSRIRF